MIRPDVAVVAGFRFAGLLQAEFVADVAFAALADRPILRRFADIMAAFAGKAGDRFAFQFGNGVTGDKLLWHIAAFGDGFVHGQMRLRQVLRPGHCDIGGQPVTALVILRHLVLVAGLAGSGGGDIQDECAFMSNRPRIIFRHFMTVLAGDIGGGHRAAPVLFDNAGGAVAMAVDTAICAVGQNIFGALRLWGDRLINGKGDKREAGDNDDGDQGDDQYTGRTSGLLIGLLHLLPFSVCIWLSV